MDFQKFVVTEIGICILSALAFGAVAGGLLTLASCLL
jgi:hypothetical protein